MFVCHLRQQHEPMTVELPQHYQPRYSFSQQCSVVTRVSVSQQHVRMPSSLQGMSCWAEIEKHVSLGHAASSTIGILLCQMYVVSYMSVAESCKSSKCFFLCCTGVTMKETTLMCNVSALFLFSMYPCWLNL